VTHHAFTVEEANELLPRLRRVLRTIRETQEEASELYERLQILDALWGEEVTRTGNPDHEEYADLRGRLADAARSVQASVETEIRACGVRFPAGGLEHGLLDFPTSWEGRWVYLCWHAGEDRVRYWHEVDAGYRGRRPITDEQAERMGREDDPESLDDSALDF
jgi:hypothetical protein